MSTHILTAGLAPNRDPPALLEIFPLMLIYAVGFMTATYLPMWVSAASTRYAVPASEAGLIGTYELGAIALATILSAALRNPGRSRIPLVAALAVSIAFNLLTAAAPSIGIFTAALSVSGLANGFLLAEVNERAAASSAPTRVFTGQLFVMMSCAAVFFGAAPRLLRAWGAGAPFLFCAATGVIAMISLLKLEPYGARKPATTVKSAFRLEMTGVLLLAAPTLLFVSMNVIWPFIDVEAAHAGISLATYSKALSAGALLNLSGPILAEWLLRGRASSWVITMTIGIVALLVCAGLITATGDSRAFLAGVLLLPFFLIVLVPFYLSFLLRSDPSGKLVAVSSAFFMIGAAIGPGLGGLALGTLGLSGLALASILAPALALLATWVGAVPYARCPP